MPSKTFPAKWSSKCEVCGQEILENQTIGYRSRYSKNPSHEACLYAGAKGGETGHVLAPSGGANPSSGALSPLAASSVGQGGPKPESGRLIPAPVAVPAQAVLESPEFAERVFVQIAGWVPSDKAEIVVRAIVEARK